MDWVWEDTTELLLMLSVTIVFGYVRKHSFFIPFFLTDAYWIVCEWNDMMSGEKRREKGRKEEGREGGKEGGRGIKGRENQTLWKETKQTEKKKG